MNIFKDLQRGFVVSRKVKILPLLMLLPFVFCCLNHNVFAQDITPGSSVFVLRVRKSGASEKDYINRTQPKAEAASPKTKTKTTAIMVKPKKSLKPSESTKTKTSSNISSTKPTAETSSNTTPGIYSGGVLNGKIQNLPAPTYPKAALAVGASGTVNVQVLIDENGDVISSTAVSGHPLLRQAAEEAAAQTHFYPTTMNGKPIRITGIIVYNFVK